MDHLMHSPYDKHDVHKCSQVQVILYKQALLHLGVSYKGTPVDHGDYLLSAHMISVYAPMSGMLPTCGGPWIWMSPTFGWYQFTWMPSLTLPAKM